MISIVSAYHNRKDLFYNTLKSIELSNYKDFEYIVVDDCSDEDHRIEEFSQIFPFLKVIRLEKKDKWYINPCVVFNKGFKESKGDIIIIQNPECIHVGDILERASQINDDEYISFGCYSINEDITKKLLSLIYEKKSDIPNKEFLLNVIKPDYVGVTMDGQNGWYNHPILRSVGFHFCSAITKKNLDDLGGFDERFAIGIAYDDNELLCRIRKKGLKVNITTNPFVTHQWHYTTHNYQHVNVAELQDRNRQLLTAIINQSSWRANE